MKPGDVYLTTMVSDPPRASIADRAPHHISFVRWNEDGSSELWEDTLTVEQLWTLLKDHLLYTFRPLRP